MSFDIEGQSYVLDGLSQDEVSRLHIERIDDGILPQIKLFQSCRSFDVGSVAKVNIVGAGLNAVLVVGSHKACRFA